MAMIVVGPNGPLLIPSGSFVAADVRDKIYLGGGVYFQYIPLAVIDLDYRFTYRYMVPGFTNSERVFSSWTAVVFPYHEITGNKNFLYDFAMANIPHLNHDSNDLLKEMIDK